MHRFFEIDGQEIVCTVEVAEGRDVERVWLHQEVVLINSHTIPPRAASALRVVKRSRLKLNPRSGRTGSTGARL